MDRRLSRILATCALAVALTGCNLVYSTRPLFTLADEVGAPAMKPGVWLLAKPDCAFDEALPVKQWPKCADWVLVRPGQILSPDSAEGEEQRWSVIETLLAKGEPRVLQWREPEKADDHWAYAGVASRATDADGRIVEIEAWPALCGPPPPDDAKSKVSAEPLPGLVIDGQDCLASEAAPVRASAAASRTWAGEHQAAHWVRDAPS